ncbi:MAG TPA: hypothetical protein VNK82_12375 [Terriglobales bacterium]|nr:hypothetical protein [Terriglobales bacterium]
MGALLGIVGLLCSLVSLACAILVLIHAFQKGGVVQGLLCLCIPLYILYYAIAKFEHERKKLILTVWFGVIGLYLVVMGLTFMLAASSSGG